MVTALFEGVTVDLSTVPEKWHKDIELLSVQGAMKLSGVCEATLQNWAKRGVFTDLWVRGVPRAAANAVRLFIRAQVVRATQFPTTLGTWLVFPKIAHLPGVTWEWIDEQVANGNLPAKRRSRNGPLLFTGTDIRRCLVHHLDLP